jgi:hypothetical protein
MVCYHDERKLGGQYPLSGVEIVSAVYRRLALCFRLHLETRADRVDISAASFILIWKQVQILKCCRYEQCYELLIL